MIDRQLSDLVALLESGGMVCGIEAEDDRMSTLLVQHKERTHRFLVCGDAPTFCVMRPKLNILGAWVVLPLDSPTDSYAAYPSRFIKAPVDDPGVLVIGDVTRVVELRKMGGWSLPAFLDRARQCEPTMVHYPTPQATAAWMDRGHEVYKDD